MGRDEVVRFSGIVKEAREWLQRDGRLRYRSLKREFDLDEEALEDLRDELIKGQRVAKDEDGDVLVWVGDRASSPAPTSSHSQLQSPATYTPQHLAERIRAEQQAMESRGASDGERKTITALFADLKGSTALIEGLDPEEARAIIDPALQLMMDAVHRYDGYVAQALGDGIFALFGAPIAHEDHPQRALYAALRMQEEMQGYAERLREEGGAPLQMRVGVNTGEVVVRSIRKDDLHTDYVPVGHSTNLAARMEQLANPGSIVVSEHTHKLTDGYFAFQALGKTKVKGVAEPVPIYEVMGAGPLRTRLQVSARRGLTRFVGRHSEMEQLQAALEQAKAGHGQIVGVMGEPGLGKSRLFYEFKLSSQSGCLILEAFAVSHGQNSPYLPLIELLKEYFQIEPGDDERSRRQKVLGHVLDLDRSLEETLPYLFALLGIEDHESSLQQMDAQIRRTRTFDALKRLFLRESLNQPLTLVFEDLHWIDNETQGFLDTLSESVASANLLLLANYRPEYRHEWGGKTYYTQLRLAPLGQVEAEELLTFLLGSDASLTTLKELILTRTDGTPFFMEEVVQTLSEEGKLIGQQGNYSLEVTPTELQISPTVQGVLAARIDRLSPDEKTLLQQLAVIGRQFPMSLVHQVVTQPEDELYRTLASLQAKEFLYEQPAFPESEFIFKHALTQDVAYGTVLQEERKALHERTGQAIEALYTEKLNDHYTELAHHYRQSRNNEKAVEYLYLAGQQALVRSANDEAIRYLKLGLNLLKELPANGEHRQQEFLYCLTLGPAFMTIKGYGASEVEQTYIRARALSEKLGDPAQQYTVLRGLWVYYDVRAELSAAQAVARQMLELAERVHDENLLTDALFITGRVLFDLGQLRSALAHFRRSLALYDPEYPTALRYGFDTGVALQDLLAWTAWVQGYPDQALSHAEEGQTRAQHIAHPASTVNAMTYAAAVHQWRYEPHATQQLTEGAMKVAVEQGATFFQGWIDIHAGWVVGELGDRRTGITRIQNGLSLYSVSGAMIGRSSHLAILAEAYEKANQTDEGLRVLDEAQHFIGKTEERWYEAELYRLKGELTLQQSQDAVGAEACFHKAIEVAQHQQAKSWELRAATSLARLWQGQGKTTEARELLAPVYEWFSEGFDTADLKDAKALLNALGEGG